jgi:hypothetical protein
MGSGSSAETSTSIRFAPYIEALHQDLVAHINSLTDAAMADNPFKDYTDIDIEDAFFGAGYVMASFPSLYDMFGKFMAGLDIDILFDEVFEDTINGPVVDAIIADEADKLSDDLENEVLPRFELGMRDINAVMSSTFVVGRTMLDVARTKALSRFSSSFRASLLPIVTERWSKHLDWNKTVIDGYAQVMKLYFAAKHDISDLNFENQTKRVLWPFSVLEFERAAIGTMNQPQQTKTTEKKSGSVFGGILQGVAGIAGLLA